MMEEVLVILGSYAAAYVLNRFLGNARIGVVALMLTILPVQLRRVHPVDDRIIIVCSIIGVTVFVWANKEKYRRIFFH